MIPRLGDGNPNKCCVVRYLLNIKSLENDSPSRGRKRLLKQLLLSLNNCLENDSPSRGRKPEINSLHLETPTSSLENDSPSRGRKQELEKMIHLKYRLENDSPSRGRKL